MEGETQGIWCHDRPCVFSSSRRGAAFFLKMLLNHVTGCMSYQDIRTLPDGTVCDTYEEAALRLGLLENYHEADQCFAKAATEVRYIL